jgi:hypothetical protein
MINFASSKYLVGVNLSCVLHLVPVMFGLTDWLLLSLNATIHSLWDVSPGNPVSGLMVVDRLFSQFVQFHVY